MKVMQYLICMLSIILGGRIVAVNSDLNYTGSQTGFISANRVFKLNESARGFIRFNAGFTVKPDARVSMDVPLLVLGPLDLRETGTIRLISDLFLDSSVTLTSGGRIDGQGHRVVCNGDFVLSAGKVLHINGNTILDMDNHSLMISDHAQIFVDANVTLTIANATIHNGKHSPTFPPLRCGALNSKLALNNVEFCPIGDFLFPQGQLFVHNDVAFTGTSAFIYTSPVPSVVTANSCLYFDKNTTLSVVPSTFTDAPYTLKNTYTRSNFIQCVDATAALYLNGCSLLTTLSGVRFTKGNVFFDNHVTCQSDTTLTLTSITQRTQQAYGATIYTAEWSPNGKYLAVGGQGPTNNNEVQVYRFTGTTLTLISGAQVDYGSYVQSVAWSPDGRYLAIGGVGPSTIYEMQVYSFNETTLTLILGAQVDYGAAINSIAWSPDGNYLAIAGNTPTSGYEVQVYSFNGTALKLISGAQVDYGTNAQIVIWSPDGRYVIVGGWGPTNGNEVQVYSFNGTTLSLISGAQLHYGSYVYLMDMSHDGRFLAIGGNAPVSGNELQVYSFDGITLTPISGAQIDYGQYILGIHWSPDGRYLAIGGKGPLNGYEVQVYLFDGTKLTLISGAQVDWGNWMQTVRWHPTGSYLGIAGSGPSAGHKDIEVYRCDFVKNTVPQAYSSSIVFGDSSYGTSRDAMVTLLAGAHIDLTGKMSYDNFSG